MLSNRNIGADMTADAMGTQTVQSKMTSICHMNIMHTSCGGAGMGPNEMRRMSRMGCVRYSMDKWHVERKRNEKGTKKKRKRNGQKKL
ncbi:hypothetical protein OAM67_01715 [bacterium]|nr:hypothetical protein [bacterium]